MLGSQPAVSTNHVRYLNETNGGLSTSRSELSRVIIPAQRKCHDLSWVSNGKKKVAGRRGDDRLPINQAFQTL